MDIEIQGITPLILHNGRTANPLDPYSKRLKALTSKRGKTEEDVEQLLAVQWEAALYFDADLGLYMPSENLFAAFLKGAKKFKLGGKSSAVSFPEPIGYSIETRNGKNFEALKADPGNKFIRTVTIQRAKTVSCRAIFNSWAIKFYLEFETSTIDANEIKTIFSAMGSRIGLGVWTPSSPKPGSNGRFVIKSLVWTSGKTGEQKHMDTGFKK